MNNLVFWSTLQKNGVWHLYKDCKDFRCPPFLQKSGTAAEALDAGCSGLCPACRARYEAENPDPHPVGDDGCVESTAVELQTVDTTPETAPGKKTVWRRALPFLATAIVVLFFSSTYYNGKFKNDLESARSEGYSTGYNEGQQTGHDAGYTEGHDAGYDEGYTAGHTDGYAEASDTSYDSGYSDGYDDGQSAGYNTGHDAGYAEGVEAGSSEGYDKGYNEGYAEGKQVAAASYSSSYSGTSGGSSSANAEKPAGAPTTSTQENSATVYITETGSKYHRAGCSYLKKSCISISLSDAKSRGYTPCSRCNPPA